MRSWFCFLLAALLCANTYAQLDVKVEGKRIDLIRNGSPLVTIDSVSINFIAQHSQEIVYRSDDSVMLRIDYPLMPDFNRLETGFDHSLELGISFRNNTFHLSGYGDWIGNITIHMTDKHDHFFGLQETLYPDNKKSSDLRGSIIDVEVNGEQYRYKENFASAWSAFYFNPKGYASFMNTFAKGRYQLAINGKTSITHETNTLDWYIFTGDYNDIYQQYYAVIGEPKKIPVWSCGPIVWRDENKGGAPEIVDDAKQFLKLKIPLTGLMVDRPYSNGSSLWSKMDFNDQFKNPGKWIKELKDSTGLYFLTWIAPATFDDTDFPGLLKGWFNYLDLTNPAAIAEFAKRLNKNQYAYGVKGHKMDRADEQFPENENWLDRTPRQERKNKYVYLYARVTDSILKSHLGNDQLNYARAAIHGSQHYLSGIWGGDPRSTWDGMAGNLANSMRASYMGFSNWGTDVGGYLGQSGKIPEDLYIRWLQWGVFNGIYEIKIDGAGGAGEDRAPWHSSKKLQDAFRKACEMRMDLLPHIYSQLNTAGTYGTLMKPLGMVYPSDSTVYNIWDEYIFGNALLVAPVLTEGNSRRVYLPEGSWINYYTGEKLTGKKYITADATAGIPLFIKSNSIIARGNVYEGNTALWKSSNRYVDLYYYPGEGNTSMDLVDAQDNNKRYKIQTATDYKMPAINIPAIPYNGQVKIYTEKHPSSVFVNGKKAKFLYRNHFIIITRTAGTSSYITYR